ncbi:hypothetical protein Tco_0039667 [Tanacetum coccineum]
MRNLHFDTLEANTRERGLSVRGIAVSRGERPDGGKLERMVVGEVERTLGSSALVESFVHFITVYIGFGDPVITPRILQVTDRQCLLEGLEVGGGRVGVLGGVTSRPRRFFLLGQGGEPESGATGGGEWIGRVNGSGSEAIVMFDGGRAGRVCGREWVRWGSEVGGHPRMGYHGC